MKNRTKALVVALTLLAFTALNAEAQSVKVLRLGSHLAADHSVVKTAEKLAQIVSAKSGGKIEIRVFPNATIGDQRALIEGMQFGSIDMAIADAGLISNFAPRWGICDLPYVWKNYKHVRKVLDGEVGKSLQADLLSKGVRSLGWMDSGFRNVFINKEAKSLKDFKGLKLRVPESPVFVKTFQAMGVNPTVIPWGEVYTSVQTKVVDGFEQPAEGAYTAKMYEVTKYLIMTQHLYTALSINISETVWKTLTDDQRKIIADSAVEASAYGRALAEELDTAALNNLVAKGMKRVEVNQAEFQAAVVPVWKEYGEKYGATDLIQKIVDAGK